MIRSRSFGRRTGAVLALAALILFTGCKPEGPAPSAGAARALMEAGEVEGAIEILRSMIDQGLDDTEVHYLYGAALSAAGQVALAEWPLRKAMRDPEWTVRAGMLVARNAIQSRNAEAAIPPLDEILAREPENVEALLLRASAHAETMVQIEEALADVASIREIDPENVESFRPEILAYLTAARSDEARKALEALGARIEVSAPDEELDAWYCTTMALFAQESRELAEAEERFDACLEKHPANLNTVSAALDFFDSRNQTQRSLEILERASAELEPGEFLGIRSNLAFRLASLGRQEEAIELLRAGILAGDDSNAAKFASDLADLLDQLGRTAEALEAYDRALELTRRSGYVNSLQDYSVADLAIRAGDLDRALQIAESLTVPSFREMILARLAQEHGSHEEALRRYDEAARLWPNNEYARYHAARSAEALGEFDRAIELYRHAMRIARETTNAANRIAILRIAEGNPRAAFELLQIHRSRTPLDAEGELLAMELGARLGDLTELTERIQESIDRRATTPPLVLASAFRGLRKRGVPERVLDLLPSLREGVFSMNGGAIALIEIARSALALGRSDEVVHLFEAASAARPDSAEWQAADGYLLEIRGQKQEARSRYLQALEGRPEQPDALLGLARLTLPDDAAEAARLARRALVLSPKDSARIEQVEEIAARLDGAGATEEAIEVFTALLDRVPHNGVAAAALARYRWSTGDESDSTLDLARRAARFSRSSESIALLGAISAARKDGASETGGLDVNSGDARRD